MLPSLLTDMRLHSQIMLRNIPNKIDQVSKTPLEGYCCQYADLEILIREGYAQSYCG